MNQPPRPPKGTGLSMDRRCETLRVVTGPFSIWRTPCLGASLQTYDATGSRVTITRVLAVGGLLAGGMRKATGSATLAVVGRDGQTQTVTVKGKKGKDALEWAFKFNAWSQGAMAAQQPQPQAQPGYPAQQQLPYQEQPPQLWPPTPPPGPWQQPPTQ